MKDEPENAEWLASGATGTPGMPVVVDRATFQAELDALRLREKAHTREGDAIAAARLRLPMVEVDPATLRGRAYQPEYRRQLVAGSSRSRSLRWLTPGRSVLGGLARQSPAGACMEPQLPWGPRPG